MTAAAAPLLLLLPFRHGTAAAAPRPLASGIVLQKDSETVAHSSRCKKRRRRSSAAPSLAKFLFFFFLRVEKLCVVGVIVGGIGSSRCRFPFFHSSLSLCSFTVSFSKSSAVSPPSLLVVLAAVSLFAAAALFALIALIALIALPTLALSVALALARSR